MQLGLGLGLGLYRTSLVAARLSTVLKVSLSGKMTNRGMKSTPDGKTLTDNKQEQPSLWNKEEDFPSLSASRPMPNSKRKSRIELSTPERKTEEVVQNIVPLQGEASTSINGDLYGRSLPANFEKKKPPPSFRKPKPRQNYHELEVAKRDKTLSPGTGVDEPFDICFSETEKSRHRRSSSHDKNSGKWVQKVQSAEENVQSEVTMEKIDDMECSVKESGVVLRPGMVLFKRYIPLSEQVNIVKKCQELGLGPGGFYRPGYEDGAKLRLYMMCLGLDWNPQTRKYGDLRHHDNVAPPNIPDEFTSLVIKALDDSHTLIKQSLNTVNVEDILPTMFPDVCIVNFYTTNGRLGLHQDRDESPWSLRKGLPVVSISVGDSAEFLYGDERDADEAKRVSLESGDVVIFGGESRHIFHGVKTIVPNSAPRELLEQTNLRPGRLNLTFRKN